MADHVARVASLVGGSTLIAAGAAAWGVVTQQLKAQRIRVEPDSPILPGRLVADPVTAFAQAQIIGKHAADIGGGRTFAELGDAVSGARAAGDTEGADELAATRQTVLQANLLTASLFTSVLAYGVAALAGGVGVLALVVGATLPDD